jgi:hypothetical protein
MDRRTILATAGLLLLGVLAGCSAAGSLDMDRPANDTDLANGASRATTAVDGGPTSDGALVQRAIENGSATARGQDPPVERGLPFAHEGRYYDVSWNVTERRPATAVRVAIDYNGSAPSSETVAYDALSARDRAVVDQLLPPKTDDRREGYEFGVRATYNETERNRSVLLAEEPAAVGYRGETYPIGLVDRESVTVRTYRYTTSVVATNSTAYADQLRERYLFDISGLSDAERGVLEEAIDDTYYAEDTDDEAFRSVLDRFEGHEAIERSEYGGTWLVRYDGEVYLADLSYGGFDDATRP